MQLYKVNLSQKEIGMVTVGSIWSFIDSNMRKTISFLAPIDYHYILQ